MAGASPAAHSGNAPTTIVVFRTEPVAARQGDGQQLEGQRRGARRVVDGMPDSSSGATTSGPAPEHHATSPPGRAAGCAERVLGQRATESMRPATIIPRPSGRR